jgi:hypothetical protein
VMALESEGAVVESEPQAARKNRGKAKKTFLSMGASVVGKSCRESTELF